MHRDVCICMTRKKHIVLQALEQVHGVGLAHRDVKVENCHFGGADNRTLKLLDFGGARRLTGPPSTTVACLSSPAMTTCLPA